MDGQIDVTGEAPQFDIAGELTIATGTGTFTGDLSGRLYVFDDGSASSDGLVLTLDGSVLELKFRGKATKTEKDGAIVHTVTGAYSLPGAELLGLAERGDLLAAFRNLQSGTGTIALELRGRAS
jgi:hypothetical protein